MAPNPEEPLTTTTATPTTATLNEISVNGVTYVARDSDICKTPSEPTPDIQIVILQRGWVMIGRFNQDGDNCTLDNASVIRTWGTKKGLGELALTGPKSTTVLDPCGHVEFHAMTVVARLSTDGALWAL